MSKTTKIIWGIVVVVLIIGLFTTRKQEVIKIGIVAPLTGGASIYGINLVNGAKIALEQTTGLKNKYELVIEDDGTNPANAASAAQKLININKVNAIITVTSSTGNAVKKIADSAKISHICLCNDVRIAGDYSFTSLLIPADEAKVWVDEAKARGANKIGIINQNVAGFNVIVEQIINYAGQNNLSVVYEERIDSSIKDFSTSISKLRKSDADVSLIGFFPPQLDIIGQQLINQNLTSFGGIGTFAISANPTLFNGNWYTDANLSDKDFASEVSAKFPDDRFNARVAPYAYDITKVIINAIESGDTVSYIKNLTEYKGKVGRLFKEIGEQSFRSPIGIWEIRDGKPIQIK